MKTKNKMQTKHTLKYINFFNVKKLSRTVILVRKQINKYLLKIGKDNHARNYIEIKCVCHGLLGLLEL